MSLGKDMDKMIRELYNEMLRKTERKGRLGRELEEEAAGLLEDVEKRLGRQEYEEYKDNPLYIACAAEEEGFVKGFKYAFRLFAECVRE